ncbi:hypothetical protein ACJZ2D_016552 [Fusarium nematophilum]
MSDLNNQTAAENECGQGVSRTTGHSKVHEKAPQGLEERDPNSDGGKASVVPQKLQEKLPESVEHAVPNAIHDTGDTGGLHRKQ